MNKAQQRTTVSNGFAYQSAVGVAIVAGVFSVFIAVLLGIHLYHQQVTEPARLSELEAQKAMASANPDDAALAQEILQADTRLRRDQFARIYFLERGTLLLVVTLALFAGAVIWARSRRPGRPVPGPSPDRRTEQIQSASRSRLGLAGGLIVLCAGGVFWVLHAPSMPEGPAYTSMDEIGSQWPAFRGPGGLGIADFENIPAAWDEASGENILWKTPVPLPGHNSPVVWDDHIFLTGATRDAQQVYCYDAQTGALRWQRDVPIGNRAARADLDIMEDTGYAANTAVTDGKRVCALFAGGDMACFTVDGQLLWEKHFGIPDSMYGYASSLTWYENLVIVQWDVGYEGEDSKLTALDWLTGQVAWQTPRPVPNSWTSPTTAPVNGRYCVLTNASPYTIVYDAETGTELYRVDAVYGDIAATPILADGKVFTIEPYNKLVAIQADPSLSFDDPQARIAWETNEEMPDICSPVSDGRYVWTLTTPGYLSCFDITDGKRLYREALGLQFQASPTLVGGETLYLPAQDGTMLLLEATDSLKEIGRNKIEEQCFASPAFGDGRIYIRGEQSLYAIGTTP